MPMYEQITPKTYSDIEYREFSADNIYMNNDCVYLGDALYVCIKDTNHLASAPVPPNPEYWLEFNLDEEGETNFEATERKIAGLVYSSTWDPLGLCNPNEEQAMPWDETPDTAPLLLPEESEPIVASVPLLLSEESGGVQQVPPLVSTVTATVAPKKKGGKKK